MDNDYETLNLEPGATLQDIDASFRRLVKIYHPDKNRSQSDSQKFLAISNAHERLKQRIQNKSPKQKAIEKLPPKLINDPLKITLEEVFSGCTKVIKNFQRKIVNKQGLEDVQFIDLEVPVPAGTVGGDKIILPEQGDLIDGKAPGDVHVMIQEETHLLYKRMPNKSKFDLKYIAKITFREKLTGSIHINLPGLDGNIIQIKGRYSEEPLKILNKGLPYSETSEKRGDLYVYFQVVNALTQDPPVKRVLPLTLKQIFTGFVAREPLFNNEILSFKIKPGVVAGTKFVFPREAPQNAGRLPGDIIYTVVETSHPLFKRKGADIEYVLKITGEEAYLGMGLHVKIPTLENKFEEWNQRGIIENNQVISLDGKGLPFENNKNKRGNLLVRFEITPQDEPVEHEIYATLEEINKGATYQRSTTRTVMDCEGNFFEENKQFNIEIKPGTKANERIVFQRAGNENTENVAADIVFVIKNKPHSIFQRNGVDLEYTAQVDERTLESGVIPVPTLDGGMIHLQIATLGDISTLGSRFELRSNYGLPYPDDDTKRGDLKIFFNTSTLDQHLNNELPTVPKKNRFTKYNFSVTLENLLYGCTKKMKISRRVFGDNDTPINEERIVEINIKPGAQIGDQFLFRQMGDQRRPGKIAEDVIFVIESIKAHSHFKLNGANLEYVYQLSESDNIPGKSITVPTLDGLHEIAVLKKTMQNNETIAIPNQGLPLRKDPTKRGFLIIICQIVPDLNRQTSSDITDIVLLDSPSKQVNNTKNDEPMIESTNDAEVSTSNRSSSGLQFSRNTTAYQSSRNSETKVIYCNASLEQIYSGFDTTLYEDNEAYSIHVEPGAEEGEKLCFTVHSLRRDKNATNKVFIILKYEQHPHFKRYLLDIEYIANISLNDVKSRKYIEIPTLTQHRLTLQIPRDVKEGQIKRFTDYGLPYRHDTSKRGDLIVRFHITDLEQDIKPMERTITLYQMLKGLQTKVNFRFSNVDNDNETILSESLTFAPGTEPGTPKWIFFPAQSGISPFTAVVTVRQCAKSFTQFVRHKNDLIYTANISSPDYYGGCSLDVPTLEGPTKLVHINPSMIDKYFRIEGKGLPACEPPYKRGDILVRFNVVDHTTQ